jgi:peptidyl-prolyl cis-trans isomerase SurA
MTLRISIPTAWGRRGRLRNRFVRGMMGIGFALRPATVGSLVGAILILLLLPMLFPAPRCQEVMDGIAAVVDKEIILQSELLSQVQLYALQSRTEIRSRAELERLQRELLDRMIDDKLLLVQAEKDTSLKVTDREVNEALDRHILQIKGQFSSQEEFERQLAAEGFTELKLRRKYREEVRNQLLKEKLVDLRLAQVRLSNSEVREFYETYRDSLPRRPESIKLAHILISLRPSESTVEAVENLAQRVLEMARAGEDFSQLAARYSDDPSAERGGDLGFFSPEDMVPEFQMAVSALGPGEISGLVKTQFGYHIIKLVERAGERVRASHILFMLRPSEVDQRAAARAADSLYQLLEAGRDFSEVAREFSDDPDSRESGGELGWYAVGELTPPFSAAVNGLETGQVSSPTKSDFGYHLIKVLDRQEERFLTLEEDWEQLKEMAKRAKVDRQLADWLKQIRQQYYVEVKL